MKKATQTTTNDNFVALVDKGPVKAMGFAMALKIHIEEWAYMTTAVIANAVYKSSSFVALRPKTIKSSRCCWK